MRRVFDEGTKVKVIGIGGGGNAVEHMLAVLRDVDGRGRVRLQRVRARDDEARVLRVHTRIPQRPTGGAAQRAADVANVVRRRRGNKGHVDADHPFATYRAFGVPIALSTDDEGVSRIDLTHEYVRVVRTYDLGYRDVKQLSRNSLSYAFVAGASLWEDVERARPVVASRTDVLGSATPSPGCAGHLAASEKARLQWRLEGAFHQFEAKVSASAR